MAKKKRSQVAKSVSKLEQKREKQRITEQTSHETAQALAGLTGPGKVAWWSVIVLIFLVPLALSNLTSFGFSLPWGADIYDTIKVTILRIGSIVALAAWAYDLMRYGGKLRTTPIFWALGAFLLWATLATVFSVSSVTSFFGKYKRYEGLWSYFIYATLFFLMTQYATTEPRVKMIAKTLSFSSVIVALYGLGQSIGIEPIMRNTETFEAGRSFSTYGNPDLLAGFLAFGVFVTFGLALAERRPGWRFAYWFILLMNSAVTVTAYSRSIWVGAAVGFVAIVLFALRQRPVVERADYGLIGATLVTTSAYIIHSFSRNDAVTNFGARIKSIFEFNSGSALTRFEIWRAAIDAIKDRPIFGFGPDTFRLVFRRYAPVEYAQDAGYLSVADNVHNYVLQLAASVGIVGCALYYVVGFWVAGASFRLGFTPSARDDSISKQGRLIYAGLWSACLAYMVHLFFGLSLPGSSFLLFTFMGCLVAPLTREREIAPRAQTIATVGAGVGAVVVIVVATLALRIFAADSHLVKAQTYQNASDISNAINEYERATELNPFNDYYKTQYFSAKATLATAYVQASASGQVSAEEATASVVEAEKIGRETIAFMPWEYDNYSMVVMFYDQLGQLTNNTAYYNRAIKIAEEQIKKTPTGLALRYGYAIALNGAGRVDEAIEQASICAKQDTNFEAARELLAQLQAGKQQAK